MNNNINIAELLKDCPKGTKLYSTIFGEVELKEVKDNGRSVCIFVTTFYGQEEMFYPDGKYNTHYSDSECTLFPSKEQRDWSKFCPFKDGDVIYVRTKLFQWVSIFKKDAEDKITTYTDYNLDNNIFCGSNKDVRPLCQNRVILEKRIATEEEKERLFKAIKENGYRWNAETKTLEQEEKKDKFDINTLVPFESRVLARDKEYEKWVPGIWGLYNNEASHFPYVLLGGHIFAKCVPYEGNQHLLGTTNDCDEFYKIWKDETDE